MKTTLTFLMAVLCSGLLHAQIYRGTLTLENWRPAVRTASPNMPLNGPEIRLMNFKWKIAAAPNELFEKAFAMQWYLDDEYMYGQKPVAYSKLGGIESKLSLSALIVNAEMYVSGQFMGHLECDMGVTPPHGGTWGQETNYQQTWENLFSNPTISADSAKKLFAKGIELRNPTVRAVRFGGTEFVEKRIEEVRTKERFDALWAEAEIAFQQQHYDRAADLYNQAAGVSNTPQVQARLMESRYQSAMQVGDNAMNQRNYTEAAAAYERAAQITPTPIAQQRLREAKYALPMAQGEAALAVRNFAAAIQAFEAAVRINPTPEANERLAQSRYNFHLSQADAFYGQRRYQPAIEQYELAGRIYPNDLAPKDGIARAQNQIRLQADYERLVPELTTQYKAKIAEAETNSRAAQTAVLEEINAENENCHLTFLKFYECDREYYQDKLKYVIEEANYRIYAIPRKAMVPESSPCMQPTCRLLAESGTVRPTAKQYLDAAQRKFALFQQNREEAFRNKSKQLLDASIKENPKTPAAYLFGVNFETAPMQKLLWIQQGLAVEPRHTELLDAKYKIAPLFYEEFYNAIRDNNTTYVAAAISNQLAADIDKYQGKTPVQQAILHDRGDILRTLLTNIKYEEGQKPDPQQLLYEVARQNKPNSATILLALGADAGKANAQKQTPVAIATQANANDVLRILLGKGASAPEVANGLLNAVATDNLQQTQTFLDAGANVNTENTTGETALMIALQRQNAEMVRLLLKYQPNMNAQDNSRRTPLIHAAISRRADLVRLVLERGAAVEQSMTTLYLQDETTMRYLAEQLMTVGYEKRDIAWVRLAQQYHPQLAEIKSPNGKAWILRSLADNRLDVCDILLASDINFNQSFDWEYLIVNAVERKAMPIINRLVSEKLVDLSVRTPQQETSLHIAAKQGSSDIVMLLVSARAPLNLQDADGKTSLLLSVERGYLDVSQTLISAGADLRLADRNGMQVIHTAALKHQKSLVAQCIDAGVPVGTLGADRMTPLHYAAQAGDQSTCVYLLEKGADKLLKDAYARTPRKIAQQNKFKDLAKLLK